MTTTTAPDVALEHAMTSHVPCDLWENITCDRPARFRVFWNHDDDNTRCYPDLACDEHLAELAPKANGCSWECPHGRVTHAISWVQL